MSPPVRVSWFPEGDRLEALVKPTPGAVIQPSTPIQLTFSQPVKAVLGATRPKLDPPTPGAWSQTADNTLTFKPSGSGFAARPPRLHPAAGDDRHPLDRQDADGRHAHLERPGRLDAAAAPVARAARLPPAQLGAERARRSPTPPPRRRQAALNAPPGKFSWRFGDTPPQLQALWEARNWTRMTQGAVMAFQSAHGLDVDGIPGPATWHTLIKAALAGDRAELLQLRRRAPERAADADPLERRPGRS